MTVARIPERVILVGPSGSGKSELAGRLARRLQYDVIDTDARIEERIAMPVFEFFARFGEPAFRAIESEVLRDSCRQSEVVVATGGGVVTQPVNWTLMRPNAAIIGLRAKPDTLVARVNAQVEGGNASAVRPLLSGDAAQRIREQLEVRGQLYAQADITIDTDDQSPQEILELAVARLQGGAGIAVPHYTLPGAVERSDIYIGRGVSKQAAELAQIRWPRSKHVWIITDEHVGPIWAEQVQNSFLSQGFTAETLSVPAGETSKSFSQVERLCAEITSHRVSRQDLLVALGGGVVGDLAGLVASICLRGLALIQIPTSLLAMVDSSVGGKTGINTPAGKNLVGTFNQPALVLVDSEFLSTLPDEEYRSGMAEVIKHSVIQPATPMGGDSLQSTLAAQAALSPIADGAIDHVLAVNVGIKHTVVRADERESGLRMILNFGHTAGHAIEADGYRYRHGEAVALGMQVAARMALELERIDGRWLDRILALLERASLPLHFDGSADEIVQRLSHDKKNVNGSLHWVLPLQDAGVGIENGIDIGLLRRALADIGAS